MLVILSSLSFRSSWKDKHVRQIINKNARQMSDIKNLLYFLTLLTLAFTLIRSLFDRLYKNNYNWLSTTSLNWCWLFKLKKIQFWLTVSALTGFHYKFTPLNCSLPHISYQPITFQHLCSVNSCRHGEDKLTKVKLSTRREKTGVLRDLECGIVVGLSIWKTADWLG